MRTLHARLCGLAVLATVSMVCVSGAHPASGGKEDEAALARLKTMNDRMALEAEGLKPWHLKLDVQLYRAPDSPSSPSTPGAVGTVEEWWASPTRYRIAYTTPDYHAVVGADAAGRYRSADFRPVPTQLEAARREVVHPMPTEVEVADQVLELRRHDFGGGALDCLILGRAVVHQPFPPVGMFPSFCSKAGTDELTVTIDYGQEYLVRPGPAVFQGRSTAVAVAAKAGGADVLRARVEKLGEIVATDADFAAPEGAVRIPGGEPVAVPAARMKANLQHHGSPHFDGRRPSGLFVGRVLVGTDGHVIDCQTVSGTPELIGPSTAAILDNVYKPWLVNGEPNEAVTTVTMEY